MSFPFRKPINTEDPPEDWTPPDYFIPAEEDKTEPIKASSAVWKPPSYFEPAKAAEEQKPSVFSRIGKAVSDTGKAIYEDAGRIKKELTPTNNEDAPAKMQVQGPTNPAEITKLNPDEEVKFQQWIKDNDIKDLDHPNSHYDYRGFWKKYPTFKKENPEAHLTDEFKQHLHPTFSRESQYSTGNEGSWEGDKLIDSNGNLITDETPPSMLNKFTNAVSTAWNAVNKPLAPDIQPDEFLGKGTMAFGPTKPEDLQSYPIRATKEIGQQFYDKLLKPLTSPLGIGTTVAGYIPGQAARTGLGIGLGAMAAGQAPSAVSSVKKAYNEPNVTNIGDAVLETAMPALMGAGAFHSLRGTGVSEVRQPNQESIKAAEEPSIKQQPQADIPKKIFRNSKDAIRAAINLGDNSLTVEKHPSGAGYQIVRKPEAPVEPPIRRSREIPYRMTDQTSPEATPATQENIAQPTTTTAEEPSVKQPFVNPFEKRQQTYPELDVQKELTDTQNKMISAAPDEKLAKWADPNSGSSPAIKQAAQIEISSRAGNKPLPTRSPNLAAEHQVDVTKAPPAEMAKSTEDTLYNLARDKFNMGKELPESQLKAEWKPPDYFEPQDMRVPGTKGYEGLEKIAVGGADPAVLDALSESLYTRSPEVIALKELIQNAVDEHKVTDPTIPIRTATIYGTENPQTKQPAHSIIVRDSGRGLTPDQLYTIFTDVGKTGKANVKSAAGGFGFAKASPLLGGDYVEVKSVVNEGNKRIEYSFKGNPTELKDQGVGVNLDKKVVGPDTPTGLKVQVYYSNKANMTAVDRMAADIGTNSFNTPPIKHAETFGGNDRALNEFLDKGTSTHHFTISEHNAKPAPPLVDTLDLPNAKVNIHYEQGNPDKSNNMYNLNILNKGLWQQRLRKAYALKPLSGVPEDIYVDVESKIEEGKKGYPFGLNREQLQEDPTAIAINDWVQKNIVSGAVEKQRNQLQKLYDVMPKFDIGVRNRPSVFFDPGNRLNFAESALFTHNPIVRKLASMTDKIIDDAINSVGDKKWADRLEKTGLFLSDEGHSGLHVPNPAAGYNKSTIVINPFSHGAMYEPRKAALETVIAALHETGHVGGDSGKNLQPDIADYSHPNYGEYISSYHGEIQTQGGGNAGHEVDWIQRLGDIYAKYGPERFTSAVNQVHQTIADPKTGAYTPEFQKLLQIYQESRGRPATTEDLLSRTGVKQESPTGGKGNTPSNDQSSGEGASGDEITQMHGGLGGVGGGGKREPFKSGKGSIINAAVDKLFTALEATSGKRAEQDAINRSERANRFAAFAGVKDTGMKGAAKSLSALRGQYEKVDPEKLQIGQREADTLFTAVKRGNITEGEKARGYTALFKLLNGDGLPQRNELAILDSVFGGDFSSRVVEMHGGLGGVGIKISKLANTMKSMQNALSLAAPLRHGIGLAARKEFYPAFVDMFKFFANKEYYDSSMQALETRPNYLLSREAGLFSSRPGSLLNSEEEFLNSYAGRIPLVKNVVGASQRGYTGFLNKLRADVFDGMVKQAKDLGFESAVKAGDQIVPTKETEAIARFINTATGRGDLGRLNKMTNELNLALWSPRMIASRVQMFTNPKLYMDLPKGMRREGIKSLLGIAALGTTIDTLAAYNGAKISTNILSSDFGKSRFGTKLIDPWGGFQQYVVGAARFLAGKTDSPQPSTRLEIAGRFLANKESPALSLAHNLLTAKKFEGRNPDEPFSGGGFTTQYGEKTSIQSQIGKQFIPIFIQDLHDLMTTEPEWSENIGLTAAMTGASLAGMAQDYPEKKKLQFRKMQLKMK